MQVDHIAKGGEILYGHTVVLPAGYDPAKEYPFIFFIHGIGEVSDGSLAKVQNVYNWVDHNSFLLDNVDKGFCVVIPTYLNTVAEKSKVCKWILEHIKSKYKVKEDSVTFIGHSNGSHTLGTWAFADADFAKQVAVWVCSASGGFSTAATFKNVAENDVRVWGVVAENDWVPHTNTTQLATKVPAINPDATVIITKFPPTRWPDSKVAHNVVLGQITKSPLPFVTLPGITDRLGSGPKMDLYQWILSNPKGSLPQLPDQPYSGPKYAEPDPDPIPDPVPDPPPPPPPPVKRVTGFTHSSDGNTLYSVAIEVFYDDGSKELHKAEKGDKIVGTFYSFKHKLITIEYLKAPVKVIGPMKT